MTTVIHFLPALNKIGGLEKMLLRTTPKLNSYDHVFVSASKIGELGNSLGKRYEVHSLDYRNIFSTIKSLTKLINIIKSYDKVILNTYLIHSDLMGRVAGFITSIPVICFNRGSLLQWQYLRFLDRLTKGLVTIYAANSKSLAIRLSRELNYPVNKIHVIENGLDKNELTITRSKSYIKSKFNIPKNVTLVGYLGHLRHGKGLEKLIYALKDLPDSYHLLLIGDGELKIKLKDLSRALKIEKRLHISGYVKKPANYLNALDIFVFPSEREGMPNALIEALYLGKPIIASDIEECKEVCGSVAKYFSLNKPNQISKHIYNLTKNKNEIKSMRSKSRERSKLFTLKNTLKKLDFLYSQFYIS